MGGFVSFTMDYQANQRASKETISAHVSVESVFFSASGSFNSDNEMKSNSVNIKKNARTNTLLPTACADAALGDNFKPEETRACILEWMKLPPTAAYAAFAVPYAFHPDYQAAIAPSTSAANPPAGRKLLQNTTLSANVTEYPMGDSEADYRFKETGLLRLRLTRIQNTLDKYKVKEDAFFLEAQKAVEAAKGTLDMILEGLRNRTIETVDQWQPLYKVALAQVHFASLKSDYTPRGELDLQAAYVGAA